MMSGLSPNGGRAESGRMGKNSELMMPESATIEQRLKMDRYGSRAKLRAPLLAELLNAYVAGGGAWRG